MHKLRQSAIKIIYLHNMCIFRVCIILFGISLFCQRSAELHVDSLIALLIGRSVKADSYRFISTHFIDLKRLSAETCA